MPSELLTWTQKRGDPASHCRKCVDNMRALPSGRADKSMKTQHVSKWRRADVDLLVLTTKLGLRSGSLAFLWTVCFCFIVSREFFFFFGGVFIVFGVVRRRFVRSAPPGRPFDPRYRVGSGYTKYIYNRNFGPRTEQNSI